MKFNIWILFAVLFSFYFLFLIREDIMQNKELEADKATIASRLNYVSSENENIKISLKKTNDGKHIEKIARERLNFIKKGEIAFKVCR